MNKFIYYNLILFGFILECYKMDQDQKDFILKSIEFQNEKADNIETCASLICVITIIVFLIKAALYLSGSTNSF